MVVNSEDVIIHLNSNVFQHMLELGVNSDDLILLSLIYQNKSKLIEEYFSPSKNADAYSCVIKLEVEDFITKDDNNQLILQPQGKSFIEECFTFWESEQAFNLEQNAKEVGNGESDEELLKFCEKYVFLFKKHNIGVAGKSLRPIEVLPKMKKFLREFPHYSKEHILKCTKAYLDNCLKKNTWITGCGYFIYKRLENTKESEVSLLATACEDFADSPVINMNDFNDNMGNKEDFDGVNI